MYNEEKEMEKVRMAEASTQASFDNVLYDPCQECRTDENGNAPCDNGGICKYM